jgi:GT2 family glycosyltransferase
MKPPTVALVVLNWNRADLTTQCLSSIKNVPYENKRILLVDNGSTEEASTSLRMKDVEFLRSEKNLGFSRGMNLGIEWATSIGAEFVICLNNDVVVEPSFLAELLSVFGSHPDAAAASPLVMQAGVSDRVLSLGRRVHLSIGLTYSNYMGSRQRQLPPEPIRTQVLDGCCMMFKTDVLGKLGALDMRFQATEDVEISLRLARSGFSLYVNPKSVVWHIGSASKGGRVSAYDAFFMGVNWPRLSRAYGSTVGQILFWPSFIGLQLCLWSPLWVLTGRSSNLTWFLKGIRRSGESSSWETWSSPAK